MESNKTWTVLFARAALKDLGSIVEYLLDHEGVDYATEFVEVIRAEAGRRLRTLPLRGRTVPELETVSNVYREIRIKSYRFIYRTLTEQRTVRVLVIAHEKRIIHDMLINTLLTQ